jgi:VWFA-related protein
MKHAVLCALCLAGLAAQAQQPERSQQPPIRTQANYVRVDVYPLADGRPVRDLTAADFEVFEDGAPQVVESFEHIAVSPAGPQELRAEPNTVEASRQAAADPRSRLFVLFLDTGNVTIDGTWNVRGALVKLVDRVLGPQDLVGIMTPEMSPAQIAFARRTEVFEAALMQRWPWGTRHTLQEDPREEMYRGCYPVLVQEAEQGMITSELVQKMKDRRRERLALDALRDLSMYLRTLREGRTAVIVVSEGLRVFRPDASMTVLRRNCECRVYRGDPKTCQGCKLLDEEAVPSADPIGVGPGGKLGRGRPFDSPFGTLKSDCDSDRLALAQMDNDVYFRTILDDANRANVSFYPVDPRGLPVWDAPLGPERPPTIFEDQANLRTRRETLYTMAAATDGLAVMTNNDLTAGLRRIQDDLTSYYLLGYYSTNPKLDGKFRKITVRIKRPGVDVRARRGYRAPTEAEVAAARAAAPPEPVSAEEAARDTAMASLARIRPEARFRIHAAPVRGDGGAVTRVWVAGELQPFPASDPWGRGGTADLEISIGGSTASARVTLEAGQRGFLTSVALPKPVSGEAVDVRARLAGTDPDAARLADSIRVALAEGARYVVVFRRGPTTGNRYQPAATFLFSRTERVRIEIPVPAGMKAGSGRILDRAGQPLPVPVALTTRTDPGGTHWVTADVTLAPLGAGDYLVETAFTTGGGEEKVVTAIRVAR